MYESDSIWTRKGATLSDKSARQEFGLTQQEIVAATYISKSTTIQAAGQPTKLIEEFVGLVNSGTTAVSIARLTSSPGWSEPSQRPEFDEYMVVLRGTLHVKVEDVDYDRRPGKRLSSRPGSGCSTAARPQKVPSTSPSACPLFTGNGSSGGVIGHDRP